MSDFHQSHFRDDDQMLNRRGTDPTIELISHKVTKMETALDKLTDAITRLAVIEERQSSDRAALERAFAAIQKSDERCADAFEKTVQKLEKIEGRIDSLEQAAPTLALTQGWVQNAVWAAAGFAIYIVVYKMGLLG